MSEPSSIPPSIGPEGFSSNEQMILLDRMKRSASLGILAYHVPSGCCLFLNAAVSDILDMPERQLKACPWHQLPYWQKWGLEEVAERALKFDHEERVSIHGHLDSGREIWLNLSFFSFQGCGDPCLFIYLENVTDHQEVLLSLSRLASIPEQNPNPILEADEFGSLLYMNASARQLFTQGWSGELIPDLRQELLRAYTLLEKSDQDFLTREIVLGGATYQETFFHIPDRRAFRLYAYDITERLRMEEALQQARKSESLGLMAGGIAHNFNNLLQGLVGSLEVIQYQLPEDHKAMKSLDRAFAILEKLSGLSMRILEFSSKGLHGMESVDLVQLVQQLRSNLENNLTPATSLEIAPEKDLPRIQGDPLQIKQILLSLVKNAVEALEAGRGWIRISLSRHPSQAPNPNEGFWVESRPPGDSLCLAVEDSGCGIPPHLLARMFDPFFTTKEPGRGLGLSATLGIIRSHGAGLKVHSTPGRGTRFEIHFQIP